MLFRPCAGLALMRVLFLFCLKGSDNAYPEVRADRRGAPCVLYFCDGNLCFRVRGRNRSATEKLCEKRIFK